MVLLDDGVRMHHEGARVAAHTDHETIASRDGCWLALEQGVHAVEREVCGCCRSTMCARVRARLRDNQEDQSQSQRVGGEGEATQRQTSTCSVCDGGYFSRHTRRGHKQAIDRLLTHSDLQAWE